MTSTRLAELDLSLTVITPASIGLSTRTGGNHGCLWCGTGNTDTVVLPSDPVSVSWLSSGSSVTKNP